MAHARHHLRGKRALRVKWTDIFKKMALTLGVLVFIVTGYLAMSVATSCRSEALICTCDGPCIMPGSLATGFTTVTTTTAANIAAVSAAYFVELETLILPGAQSSMTAKVEGVQKDIVSLIDTLWYYNIKPAMQAMTRQLNTRDADQTRQLAAFQDAMNVNRMNLKIMEKQLETHREQRPSEAACVAATTTGGMTRAGVITRAYATAAANEAVPRLSNSLIAKSFSSMDGDNLASRNNLIRPAYASTASPSSLGLAADLADRWSHYVTNYCDSRANAKNAGCSSSAPYMNKDLDVIGEIFGKSTIDMSVTGGNGQNLNKMFVDDIVTNLAQPFVTDNIPSRLVNSPVGQMEILDRQSYKAQRQTVYDLIYGSVARRMPSGNGGASATFINELRRAAGVDTVQMSDNPSYHEVQQVMMSERFHTGSVSVEQVDESEGNAREMVIQQAMQAMQLNDMLEMMDRYALVVAAQTGNDIVKTRPVSLQTDTNSAIQGGAP